MKELTLSTAKVILPTLLTVFIGLNAVAQTYRSVIGYDSVVWNVAEIVPDAEYNTTCVLSGDTIIDGKRYKKGFDENNWQYIFLREDSSHSKLWMRSYNPRTKEFVNEILIFDLNLIKGDTFHYRDQLGNIQHSMEVKEVIDTDNQKIIRFAETSFVGIGMDEISFIEGIGPTNFGWSQYKNYISRIYDFGVLCKWENGIKTYSYLKNDSCEFKYVSTKELKQHKIAIYPNPAVNTLNIRGLNGVQTSLCLYDIKGQLKAEIKVDDKFDYNLDLSEFSEGMYVLVFRTEHDVQMMRFVKR